VATISVRLKDTYLCESEMRENIRLLYDNFLLFLLQCLLAKSVIVTNTRRDIYERSSGAASLHSAPDCDLKVSSVHCRINNRISVD
jgi:hypothetical protein